MRSFVRWKWPSLEIALLVLLVLSLAARAQSSRPGWGAIPYHDAAGTGVTFRVWAPNATSVYVPGQFNNWSTTGAPLAKEFTNGLWTGIWSADVATALVGQQYKYFINYINSSNSPANVWKRDPRGRMEQSTSGNSIIYDPSAFDWTGDLPQTRPLADLVVYEMHIGTFYDPTPANGLVAYFTDATNRLDHIRALGFSAVEVMPIAEFPGNSSWGYNLADPFAIDNAAFGGPAGGPNGFKLFVKAAHQRGLAVLVDIVMNHYGPGSLDLWNFDGWSGSNSVGGGGIYFFQPEEVIQRQKTPWGNTRPNFSSPQVCAYIRDNFRMYLDEYHVDGFRWDTPGSTFVNNDGGYPENFVTSTTAMIRTNYSGKIDISEDRQGYGFDSAWDTTYPDAVTPVLSQANDTDRDMTVIANAVMHSVRYGGAASWNRLVYLESHDVVGDLNNGQRLPTAIDPTDPDSYRARKLSTLGAVVTFTSAGISMLFQGQEMLENRQFNSSRPVDWTRTNTYSGIVRFYRDVIRLRRNLDGHSAGLLGDQTAMLTTDNSNKLIAYRRWQTALPSADVVIVANFAGTTRTNYNINFPRTGNWYVYLNTDSTNYSSDFGNTGGAVVNATGATATGAVTVGPYSALVLSQVNFLPRLSAQLAPTARVSWPIFFSDWLLDSTPSLSESPPPWVQVPAGQYRTNLDSVYVDVVPAGNIFYRLRQH